MPKHTNQIFVLGATGFVGSEVVKEAGRQGLPVKALVRDPGRAGDLAATGAELIPGDATVPETWIRSVTGCRVLIDLVQPKLPRRLGLRGIRAIAARRLSVMTSLLQQMDRIPAGERPLLISVSGLDDLMPDAQGVVRANSPLRAKPAGFGHIGIPVRHVVEQSQTPRTFVYLGTVYGPGKSFETTIFPQIARGAFRLPGGGGNRMPLVHVEDAARALVHLATLPAVALDGRSFVVADGSNATFREFCNHSARLLGAKAPGAVPRWLASFILGSVLCETLTSDIGADPFSLTSSGFAFRYPSFVEGLPPTLARLGYALQESAQSTTPSADIPVRNRAESGV
ncbi:MAG: NAD-dependent epimerase/dehydratase family protein [Acidobacteria bacterium]|nr:NAD-dependent epimerase/dehydratase family protein [Acidobacteriota bacterium]